MFGGNPKVGRNLNFSNPFLWLHKECVQLYVDFYTRTCRIREDRDYWMKKQLKYRGYDVQWSD